MFSKLIHSCAIVWFALMAVSNLASAQNDSLITEFRVINDRALIRVANTSEAYFVFVVATNLFELEEEPDESTVIARRSSITDWHWGQRR